MASISRFVAIGASSGGLDPVLQIVRTLPKNFSGAVAVVIHHAPNAPLLLPDILSRAGEMTVTVAHDGDKVEAGRIYVPPMDHHLLVESSGLRVTLGPKENG